MLHRATYLTEEGLIRLQTETEHPRSVRRAEVATRIRTAGESGSAPDNAGHEEARSEQAFVEERILEIDNILANPVVTSHDNKSKTVDTGSTVTVETKQHKKENYVVIGSAEASPLEGKISNESPVGRALIDHKVGDVVQVETPSKVIELKITRMR